jgi:hypothetical protein
MKRAVLMMLLAGCGGSSTAPAADLDAALEACARGDVDQAERLASALSGPDAVRLRARVYLMKNRNREAIEILTTLIGGKAKNYEAMERQQQVLPDLALAYVRQDDFLNASRVYGMMGEAIAAKKYEALARTVAYASTIPDEGIALDWLGQFALPVVSVTVNGRRAALLIDTLTDQVSLDRGFAKELGIEAVGLKGAGSFDEATLSEMGFGRATVRNVPIHLGEAYIVGSVKVDGVIGLQFLMHYDFTLDYRRARLVLRRAGSPAPGQPAILLGDRYLVTASTSNGKDRLFAALGTSLRGVTLAASEHFLAALGGEVLDFQAAQLKLVKPALDLKAFPAGLDGSFGVPVGYVLGHAALKGRILRVEPRSMRISID